MDGLLVIVCLCFSYTGLTRADVMGAINLDATGCLLGNLESSPGFNARFYSFPIEDAINLSNSDYYATSYLTQTPVNSAFGITDPQISFYNTANTPTTGEIYNLNIVVTNFLL